MLSSIFWLSVCLAQHHITERPRDHRFCYGGAGRAGRRTPGVGWRDCFASGMMKFGLVLPGVGQRFSQGFLERLAAEILADDLALPIQEEGRRDAIDAVFGGELVLPTFTVKILHPGELFGFQKAFELLLVLVKADTDDFKAVAVMLVVSLKDIGQFCYTRDAPGRPEFN